MTLTGYQSFTEGINRSAIIFYQIMNWKQPLADAFKQLCLADFPSDKELHKFNEQVLREKSENIEAFCIDLAKFIFENETKLISQMHDVKHRVNNSYNLIENLIPQLKDILEDPALLDLQLEDYRHTKDRPANKKPRNCMF